MHQERTAPDAMDIDEEEIDDGVENLTMDEGSDDDADADGEVYDEDIEAYDSNEDQDDEEEDLGPEDGEVPWIVITNTKLLGL